MKKTVFIIGLLLSAAAYAQEKPKPQAQPAPQQQLTIEQLYQLKGQLITTIEVAQAQLAEVNKTIIERVSNNNAPKN